MMKIIVKAKETSLKKRKLNSIFEEEVRQVSLELHKKEEKLKIQFWKNVNICLKATIPLMVVLRLVDSDVKTAMGFMYEEMDYAKVDFEVKHGLLDCMKILVKDLAIRKKINMQFVEFHYARGLFALNDAKECRKAMLPAEWWKMFGDLLFLF
uniref:Uncharacterized protein n=1 Tax=Cajanus cajan TaxID=3821 RepID=A0A151RUK3_CAJCA|nr:hypothetical protein KK1_032205 [Cajanus cajan]KYP59809.1 hypothetical protein KK1_015250 [Cajanus cajan]